jgi:hypothetical protein
MVDFKITKIQKIHEVRNDMVHNYYFIYYGKIYNENKTKFRRFKYVEWFDIFDVMEFFEKDIITKEDVKEYAHNLENSYLYNIKNYDDEKNLKGFYNYCNNTIKNFNSIL